MRKRRWLIGLEINAIDGEWYDLDGNMVPGSGVASTDGPGELILEIEQDDDTGGRPVNPWSRDYAAGGAERDLVAAWIEQGGRSVVTLDAAIGDLAAQYRGRIEDYEPPSESRDYE